MSTELRVERTYPHPRERVWRALTDPELLGRWLMPNDFEPVVGHRFTFETEPGPGFDGIVHCEVLELVEGERLVISWRGGPLDTMVSFTLADAGAGPGAAATRLVVVQTGFRGLRAWIVGRILAIGSRTIYGKRLPAVLDELSADGGGAPPDEIACMSPVQSVWIRLLRLLQLRRTAAGPTTRESDT